jgi:hypothetical protein
MSLQCNCPHRRWGLPNLIVNIIRLMLAVWVVLHALPPTVVLHIAVTLTRLVLMAWIIMQGALL